MSIKIQINSVEALERLIGGDTDVEIEIRNSIVQEFTKKHLKSLATTPTINEVATLISEELKGIVLDSTKDAWGGTKYELNPEMKDKVRMQAKKVLDSELSVIVEEEVQLLGLGFNATVRDNLIVKLQGSFNRVLKIQF